MTPHQSSLFDPPPSTPPEPKAGLVAARAARDRAVAQVDRGNRAWIEQHALPAIRAAAREHDTFTTDQVWERIEVKPDEHRAMGAAMQRAKKEGVIRPTNDFRQSTRGVNHAYPSRVWTRV